MRLTDRAVALWTASTRLLMQRGRALGLDVGGYGVVWPQGETAPIVLRFCGAGYRLDVAPCIDFDHDNHALVAHEFVATFTSSGASCVFGIGVNDHGDIEAEGDASTAALTALDVALDGLVLDEFAEQGGGR